MQLTDKVGNHRGAEGLKKVSSAELLFVDRLGSPVSVIQNRTALFLSFRDKEAESLFFKEVISFMKKIGIVMGSDSDLPVVEKAMATLEQFGVPFEAHIYSAHRTPAEAGAFARGAREKGFGAIIAAAGKAAHLAGAMAANTTLPVIGIPIKASTLDGLDALLSTVQMPGGLPVATVAIDGAENAALLAIQILAVEDAALAERLDAARKEAADKVLAKNRALEERYAK